MTGTFHTPDGTTVPAVTAEGMAAVDRVAVEEFGLALLSMMENAGRNLASAVREVADGPVAVLAGSGGNGGGGLAAARHLHNRGTDVRAVLDRPATTFEGAAARQLGVLRAAGVPIAEGIDDLDSGAASDGTDSGAASDGTDSGDRSLHRVDAVVDALIGYGLSGEVRGTARDLILATGATDATVISLDVPSGLDATTGEAPGPAVAPDRVLTLALPKQGLDGLDATLYLGDIGIPGAVYSQVGIDYVSPFDKDYTVRIEPWPAT